MSFYANLLSGAYGRLGHNHDDPDRADNPVDWKLSFAAKPKKNIDLTLEKKVEAKFNEGIGGNAGSTEQIEKTVSTLKHNHGDCTTKITWANDKMAGEGKGKLVDDDGWKVDITGALETKQAKSEWKVTGKLDVQTPDMGGAKAAVNASVDYNQKGEVTIKPNVNVEISDEINIGVNAKLVGGERKELWPQLVYKPSDNKNAFYWARLDMTRSLFRAGCDQQLKDGINHSFEFIYGWKDFKGIMDKPVALLGGTEYELSDKTTLATNAIWQGDYDIESSVEHKVDSNWTVSATQTYNSSAPTGCSPYHIGFSASYKL